MPLIEICSFFSGLENVGGPHIQTNITALDYKPHDNKKNLFGLIS